MANSRFWENCAERNMRLAWSDTCEPDVAYHEQQQRYCTAMARRESIWEEVSREEREYEDRRRQAQEDQRRRDEQERRRQEEEHRREDDRRRREAQDLRRNRW